MIEFKAVAWFVWPTAWPTGLVLTVDVECDRERDRQDPGLVGQTVLVDGREYVVLGVERRMPLKPIAKGEIIGLRVKKLSFKGDD